MASRFGLRPDELIVDIDSETASKILEEKEKNSELKYDTPPEPKIQEIVETSQSIEQAIEEQKIVIEERPNLGKSISTPPPQPHVAMDGGWKNLPLHLLPTDGKYYPVGTQIAIRSAETKEIRHFSTIEESDLLSIEDKLNYILDKCTKIYFGDAGLTDYRDIKYEDRFYIILAIRDLTFLRGENRIILKPQTDCSKKDCPLSSGIELRTGVLSEFQLDPKIESYYNEETRSYELTIARTESKMRFFIPSIGVMEKLTSFYKSEKAKRYQLDDAFKKIAPYIFPDWRTINDTLIINQMREMDYWTKEEFSLAYEISKRLKVGTKPVANIKCNCGAEVTAPISFPGGYKSLFVISDIFRDLL